MFFMDDPAGMSAHIADLLPLAGEFSAGKFALQLVLLVILIFINAFFAASEMAIVSLNDTKIRRMAEEGHKKAQQVLRLTENSSRFLATIQIGVTLAGFLTSAFAAKSLATPLADWFTGLVPAVAAHRSAVEGVCVVVITLLMSYFSLVIGELVPKRIAMQKAEAISFRVVGILRAVSVMTAPFVKLLSASTNLVVRLCGMDPHAEPVNVTEEEIRMMVDVGEEKGVIEESQKDMINNIFEFDDTTAAEVMTPRTEVAALDVEDGITEALQLGVDEGYSRLPVYEEDIDHIIGVLYIKDLLPYVGRDVPEHVTLRHLLRETYFVPGTKKCGELFAELTERRIQMAVVIDEHGGVDGIVTMEDLLEAIVGNIQDEFDDETDEITRISDTVFDVDGGLAVEEVAELTGVALPEGDYDTLAGFLMDRLGRIPAEHEHPQVEFEHLRFTVTGMDEMRIERVHVEVLPPADGAEHNE